MALTKELKKELKYAFGYDNGVILSDGFAPTYLNAIANWCKSLPTSHRVSHNMCFKFIRDTLSQVNRRAFDSAMKKFKRKNRRKPDL